MPKDINVVVMTGRAVDEPKLEYRGNNQFPIGRFKLANNVSTGKFEQTNFVNVKTIGKQAEVMQKYLTKGRKVMVRGMLSILSGKDDNGEWWTFTQIEAEDIQFMDSQTNGDTANKEQSAQSVNTPDSIPPSPFVASAEDAEFDEELPF